MTMLILKKNYPNVYIFIVAFFISVWFRGVNNILTGLIKQDTFINGILLCSLALFVFYSDDGSIKELYNYNFSSKAAAAHAYSRHR